MNQYYKQVQANSLSNQLAGVLLGAQGQVADGLFGVGIIGIAGSLLAGILSWNAVSISMHHMPGVSQLQRGPSGNLPTGAEGGGGGGRGPKK